MVLLQGMSKLRLYSCADLKQSWEFTLNSGDIQCNQIAHSPPTLTPKSCLYCIHRCPHCGSHKTHIRRAFRLFQSGFITWFYPINSFLTVSELLIKNTKTPHVQYCRENCRGWRIWCNICFSSSTPIMECCQQRKRVRGKQKASSHPNVAALTKICLIVSQNCFFLGFVFWAWEVSVWVQISESESEAPSLSHIHTQDALLQKPNLTSLDCIPIFPVPQWPRLNPNS